MVKSKLKTLLETLQNPKPTVDIQKIIEDVEKDLDVIKSHTKKPEIKIFLQDLDDFIRLIKNKKTIGSAKKQAKSVEENMRVHEDYLKKILAKHRRLAKRGANQSGFSTEKQNDDSKQTSDMLALQERSKKAAAALVHDNPDITDLSDPNRPTKIAERFSELYDNEWTDAFEEDEQDLQTIISDLLEIVKSAYTYCTGEAEKRIPIKTAETADYRNRYRKVDAHKVIPEIQEGFLKNFYKSGPRGPEAKEAFMNTCVELCWWMCIQERAVYMCNVDNEERFNRDFYRAYTKSGSQLDYIVWPALLLYKDKDKDGPVLYRGVAQFK